MRDLATKLRNQRLFSHIPAQSLEALLDDAGITEGAAGDDVGVTPGDIVVLLEGGMTLMSPDGGQLTSLSVTPQASEPGIVYTIPTGAHIRLTRPSMFVVVDGEGLDTALSHHHHSGALKALAPPVRDRVEWLRHAQAFNQMPLDDICRAAEAMTELEVSAGEEIVRAREKGEFFYVVEQGQAEVWRPDPVTQEMALVAMLGPGSTFGEEALLQDGLRNATVRMSTEGRLLQLSKADFDRLLKAHLLHEVGVDEAARRMNRKAVELIDCRYEAEYELWRIPGARLMPLDTIRERARGLDGHREYLVYCRSGRRSRAAAFLLRQMGLKASSMKGGIAVWPFEIEGAATGA